MSSWVDFLDARRRLVREWASEGLTGWEIAERLEVDGETVELVLREPTEPPPPGSARAVAVAWRMRCAELEREISRMGEAAEREHSADLQRPTRATHIRAILRDPDPERCGCRFWQSPPEEPRNGHHPQCPEGAGDPSR